MRFQQHSIKQAARRLTEPFSLLRLTDVDEYGCFLFRCEGELPLHRHLEHDELFWPLDRGIRLRDPDGERWIEAGAMARVPRGWRHGSAAERPAYVLLVSRGERSLTLNGHHTDDRPHPPEQVDPEEALEAGDANTPAPLLDCDRLRFFAERVDGTGASRRADGDVLVVSNEGSLGLRCGGIVTVLAEGELARVPAGSGWHLFGAALAIWATAVPSPTAVDRPEEDARGAGDG